jgi:phosphonate transport system substrate-binding protein
VHTFLSSKRLLSTAAMAVLLLASACGTIATPAANPNAATSEAASGATKESHATEAAATAAVTESATAAPTESSTAAASGKTFVIGDVSGKPTASIELLQPVADYLAGKLASLGYTAGTVKVAPDFKTIAEWLKSGEVDMIFQTPYPAVLLEEAVGAKSVLRRWRNGDAEYHTVIFARADSGIKTVDGMKGHMMAVQDEYSTSSYALPLAYLKKWGVTVTKKDAPDSKVDANEVGYVNSNSDDNTLQWIISGKVSLAATDNRTYARIPEETRNQLAIISETDAVPRNLLVVRPGMDTALIDAIKAALIELDKTDEGKTLLANFQKTAKFDEFPDGPDKALAYMRELAKLLK